tara:strand:- start:5482 stop:5745 length:264 start_codon:yes stop_codon:yes gene_type:complete
MITAGYLKDAIAFVGFIIAFIVIYLMKDLNEYKTFFLIGISIAICADGAYSFFPDYHNTEIGLNIPTIIVFSAVLAFLINIYVFASN